MTKADRKRIEKFIQLWQKRLGLESWEVRLSDSEPATEEQASVDYLPDHQVAVIRVQSDAIGNLLEDLTVLHELLHLTESNRAISATLRDNPVLKTVLFNSWESGIDDTARYLLRLEEQLAKT